MSDTVADLGGRVFVVTGATGALGRAVVARLLARGASVAAPYRSADKWREIERALPGRERLWSAAADVSFPESAQEFVQQAVAALGHLDGLATVAGAYAGGSPLEKAPASEWPNMLGANLAPTYAICRAALPALLTRGGSVVTVAARLATEGGAGSAAYAVSKAAVVALTRVLALENRERGVRFNCVAPGTIDTAANRSAMPGADTKKWTPPEAIADVIAFLLSPASSPTTGALVPVDLA